jgi:thiamine-phosphate pyrophosphorylase
LEQLAREAVKVVRGHSSTTRLLINSRSDVACAVGADGVHLTSTDISASDARAILTARFFAHTPVRNFLVAVSCHSVAEVRSAESHGADFVVLAPIFEKAGTNASPVGLETLRSVTRTRGPDLRVEAGDNRVAVPVLALGGVNRLNAADCLRAGAAGIAGIRLFQEGRLKDTVKILRDCSSQ